MASNERKARGICCVYTSIYSKCREIQVHTLFVEVEWNGTAANEKWEKSGSNLDHKHASDKFASLSLNNNLKIGIIQY